MNKVLVFCSDVVPLEGLPTSGGGLRSWQIIQGLEMEGFEVVYSMPRNRFLRRQFDKKIPQEHIDRLWDDSNQDRIIERVKPDVIVCVKPATRKWRNNHGIPVAVDFHGPDLIEFEQMAKFFLPTARFTLATRKLQSVSVGDFFTCAGRRQRYYFMGFLMLAGVDISDLEIHYMPVAMPAEMPEHEPDLERRPIIFSGGFYPWLNPMPALRILAETLNENGVGCLDIYGGSHETNPEDKAEFERFREDMSRYPSVAFHGFVSRAELLDRYRTAYVAFELMPRNAERELAFTTRTVEYLWAGVPVIYNDYGELTELIRDYDAGWLVCPTDRAAIAEVINHVQKDPDAVLRASHNARLLVKEHLVYERVIGPLAGFCRNPRVRKRDTGTDFLIIPSEKKGFGYIDQLYLHYRRLPFKDFVKALFTAAYVLGRNKIINR